MKWIRRFSANEAKRNIPREMTWEDWDDKSLVPFKEFLLSIDFQEISNFSNPNSSLDVMVFGPSANSPELMQISQNIYVESIPHGVYLRCPEGVNESEFAIRNICFGLKVETGGSSGGDCWGGESESYETGYSVDSSDLKDYVRFLFEVMLHKHPYLQTLDELIDKFFGNYNNFHEDSYTSDGGDFYGNYTNYRIAYVKIFDIYKFFVANSCF